MKSKKLSALFIGFVTTFLMPSWGYVPSSPNVKEVPKLFPISQNNKTGYINSKGDVVIQPQFENPPGTGGFFSQGLAGACIGDGNCGYIDDTGKFVINPQFQTVGNFSEGLAIVMVNGKIGYIDRTGKTVINPQFEPISGGEPSEWKLISSFSENLASVRIGDKCGFIDKEGKIVIKPQFNFAFPFSEGLAAVRIKGKEGFVDKTGKFVIDSQFDGAYPFVSGLAIIQVGEKFGYIDRIGRIVIHPQFDLAMPFSEEGLAWVGGVETVGPKRDAGARLRQRPGESGVEIVEPKRKINFGFINKQGKYAIKPQFALERRGPLPIGQGLFIGNPRYSPFAFSEGLAPVQVGGKWGYIDKTGHFVINPQFRLALSFYGGLAPVETDSGFAWIDKSGKYVWQKAK